MTFCRLTFFSKKNVTPFGSAAENFSLRVFDSFELVSQVFWKPPPGRLVSHPQTPGRRSFPRTRTTKPNEINVHYSVTSTCSFLNWRPVSCPCAAMTFSVPQGALHWSCRCRGGAVDGPYGSNAMLMLIASALAFQVLLVWRCRSCKCHCWCACRVLCVRGDVWLMCGMCVCVCV